MISSMPEAFSIASTGISRQIVSAMIPSRSSHAFSLQMRMIRSTFPTSYSSSSAKTNSATAPFAWRRIARWRSISSSMRSFSAASGAAPRSIAAATGRYSVSRSIAAASWRSAARAREAKNRSSSRARSRARRNAFRNAYLASDIIPAETP